MCPRTRRHSLARRTSVPVALTRRDVRRHRHADVVVHAFLFCSDAGCAAVFEAYGPLGDVLALACECGCGLELASPADPLDDSSGPLVVLEA
jgi:hypothetical protein